MQIKSLDKSKSFAPNHKNFINQNPQRKNWFNFIENLLPLPWEFWPAEARLFLTLISFWSIAGLFILGSASWWVASREMGDGAYYIKRQLI